MLRNKIKKIKGFLLIIIVTVVIIIFLKVTNNNKTLTENNTKPYLVKTEKIILKELKPQYLFYGNIKAQGEVEVIAKLSGKIITTSPKVMTNGYFEKEEVIFELDPFTFKQELIEKKSKYNDLISELNSMTLIYEEAKRQKELNKKNYERKKKLVGDIITKKNLEDAALNLSNSKAKELDIKSKIQSLSAKIEIANTQVKIASRNLKDTKYKAPFDGKLANNYIEVGAELISGVNLGKFINTKKLNVEFFVGENAYTNFSNLLGEKVKVLWTKSNFKKKYLAEIFYIDSTINQDRAGLNLRASLEGIDLGDPIKPGVFVEVMLEGSTIYNSFLIDENNIYDDNYILILEESKAVRKKIDIKGFIGSKVIVVGENLINKNLILTRINNTNLIQKVISKNNNE